MELIDINVVGVESFKTAFTRLDNVLRRDVSVGVSKRKRERKAMEEGTATIQMRCKCVGTNVSKVAR